MKEVWIRFLNILNALRNHFKKDPEKHCEFHRKHKCEWVNTIICDVNTCRIRKRNQK